MDLHQFTHHCKLVIHITKNLWECYVYGECTYTRYGVCNEPLHMTGCKGPQKDINCFLKYHDPFFFGLYKNNYWMTNMYQKADWTIPSTSEAKLNTCYMRNLDKSKLKKKRESTWLVKIIDGFQDVLDTQVYRTLRTVLNKVMFIIKWIRSYFINTCIFR